MTSIINKSFTTLIVFLLFSGCLSLPQSEDSESKLECEEKIILSHEDLVERDSEKIVVANVRHFDNAANLQDVLIFTEPVIGSISLIDLPCEGNCQEINLSSETFQAPVRVDAADLDAESSEFLAVDAQYLSYRYQLDEARKQSQLVVDANPNQIEMLVALGILELREKHEYLSPLLFE